MDFVLTEPPDGRSLTTGQQESYTIEFRLEGTDNEVAARQFCYDNLPTMWGGYPIQGFEVKAVLVDEANSYGRYRVIARYNQQAGLGLGLPGMIPVYTFEYGAGTQHIAQSIKTLGRYPGTAPDYKGAINVVEAGGAFTVQGADIIIPQFTWSERVRIASDTVNKPAIAGLMARTNKDTFKGCAPGECLFLGASGSTLAGSKFDITFRFAASPNRANFTVGDITVTAKPGWALMWASYRQTTDAGRLIKKPVAVYVEQVYEEGDFGTLGIGTT